MNFKLANNNDNLIFMCINVYLLWILSIHITQKHLLISAAQIYEVLKTLQNVGEDHIFLNFLFYRLKVLLFLLFSIKNVTYKIIKYRSSSVEYDNEVKALLPLIPLQTRQFWYMVNAMNIFGSLCEWINEQMIWIPEEIWGDLP